VSVVPQAEWRLFIAPDGQVYRVYRAPRERASGISPIHRSLVFETEDGDWIGTVPVVAELELRHISVRDLLVLLEWAQE
jgi:hypothetical protein